MGRRAAAAVIDLLVAFSLVVGAGVAWGGKVVLGTEGFFASGAACGAMLFLPLYWLIPETLGGATLGKLLLGLRIVPLGSDDELQFGQVFRRDLLKALDALFLYIGGTMAALSNPLRQTTADRWARTMVVEVSRFTAWRGVGDPKDFKAWLATMKTSPSPQPAPDSAEEKPGASPPVATPPGDST